MTFKKFFNYMSYTALIWTAIYSVIGVIAWFGSKAVIDISEKKDEEKENESKTLNRD